MTRARWRFKGRHGSRIALVVLVGAGLALAGAAAHWWWSTRVSDLAVYESDLYGVRLLYPAAWRSEPGYGSERWSGRDGFFMLGAAASEGTPLDRLAEDQAQHHLLPYGSRPTVTPLTVDGQEARLIWPSADQAEDMAGQAELIVRAPRPIEIAGTGYEYLILWADKNHIRDLAGNLEFIPGD